MIALLFKLLKIAGREKPATIKAGVRYRVTLDLPKVKPGMAAADVPAWLAKMGFTPTAKPNVWKAYETHVARLPREAVVRSERL